MASHLTEKQFQTQVVELATYYGWEHFHPYEMRRSDPGWPDLTLARTPEVLFAELKTDRGRLTDAQRFWIELLRSCGQEVHVWRPRDFEYVHRRLRRSRGYRGSPSATPSMSGDE